jgi:hypothetical protein
MLAAVSCAIKFVQPQVIVVLMYLERIVSNYSWLSSIGYVAFKEDSGQL